jgi:hypothetical protein
MEGGFARCYPSETRVDGIFWPHAAGLQLRDITRGQVEVNVRLGLGCRGRLIGRRRIGRGNSGLSLEHLYILVTGRSGEELVARIAFVRTVNLGVDGRSSPDVPKRRSPLIQLLEVFETMNHNACRRCNGLVPGALGA